MKIAKQKNLSIWLTAFLYSAGFFIIFGVVTDLIQNKFFLRMTPTTFLDYVLLALTSLLLGTYISFHIFEKKHLNKSCTVAAYSGGIGGFLGFSCPICNQILVLLLGVGGVLTYIEPYRLFIGFMGIGLMSYAVYAKGKSIKVIKT